MSFSARTAGSGSINDPHDSHDSAPPYACQPLNISTSAETTLEERLRVQTLARYLAPAHITADIIASVGTDPVAPRLSTNTHLTALTQLGPLKLACDRGFVSLLDTNVQYIAAEATRSISLRQIARHSVPQDALLLGVQALDKSYGICPNAVRVFTDRTGDSSINTTEIVANTTKYVIRDLRALDAYRDKPYVTGFPHMVSYAEVPLKASNGMIIGSYCVMDTKLRDDFLSDDTTFELAEIAATIVDHLEMITVSRRHETGARLLEGLSQFADSKSDARSDCSVENLAHYQVDTVGSLSTSSAGRSVTSHKQSRALVDTYTDPSSVDVATKVIKENSGLIPIPLEAPAAASSFTRANIEATPKSTTQFSYNLIYTRAARLICDAMDLQGVVFLGGPAKGWNRETHLDSSADTVALGQIDTSATNTPTEGQSDTQNCRILGSSLMISHGSNYATANGGTFALSQSTLQYFTREFPDGHIFLGDEHGIFPSQGRDMEQSRPLLRDRAIDMELPRDFLDVFKGSRSIVFLPIWDGSKDQCVANLFGWSADPARVISEDDCTCLIAFSDALTTELARLEAVSVARAKSDFVSSISHELRSPLHGILASAELLNETLTVQADLEMVRMIESCGNTLLDTLNHLLDFSKVNHQESLRKDAQFGHASDEQKEGVNGQVGEDNLADLIEGAVEGVYFGHLSNDATDKGFSKRRLEPLLSLQPVMASSPLITGVKEPIAVLVSVENRNDWRMMLQAGGWKRIVMNLFANALKYTQQGFVKVSLKRGIMTDNEGKQLVVAVFSVSDTGIGISPEYLRQRLYQPFAQENSDFQGMGLGLSMVKQITTSLDGFIDVQSEVGSGTTIKVTIPLQINDQIAPSLTGGDLASAIDPEGLLRGKTICVVPKTYLPSLDDIPDGLVSIQNKRLSEIRSVVKQLAQGWFQMRVISSQDIDSANADMYLVDSEYVSDATAFLDRHADDTRKIIFISPASKRHEVTPRRGVTHMDYPIGPRALGRAMLQALQSISASASLPLEKPSIANGNHVDAAEPSSVVDSHAIRPLPSRTQSSVASNAADPGANTKHVLIVDDNIINVRLLETFVKKQGCTSTSANDGQQAIDRFSDATRRFDLVFMDLSMPVLNGFDASIGIRKIERKRRAKDASTPRVRIIALSGLGSDKAKQKAAESGIDEFRTKPVALKDVKAILAAL